MSGKPTVVFEGDPNDLPSTPTGDGVQGGLFDSAEPEPDDELEEVRPSGMPGHVYRVRTRPGLFEQRRLDIARAEGRLAHDEVLCWRPRCQCGARHVP